MYLRFQESSIGELKQLASRDVHSVLIEGGRGTGKTYLSKYYGKILGIDDFMLVTPSVNNIREYIDTCYHLEFPVVMCIENLDKGKLVSSYTLLKFLEEPTSKVYVIVTCSNRYRVPSTIVSRSSCVTVPHPTDSDIEEYCKMKESTRHNSIHPNLRKCMKDLDDVDSVINLDSDHMSYYSNLDDILDSKDKVSSTVWRLSHYDDSSKSDLNLVMKYLMTTTKNRYKKYKIIECINSLDSNKMSSNAILSKLVLECKYGC